MEEIRSTRRKERTARHQTDEDWWLDCYGDERLALPAKILVGGRESGGPVKHEDHGLGICCLKRCGVVKRFIKAQ
jgi:hypothetical protein